MILFAAFAVVLAALDMVLAVPYAKRVGWTVVQFVCWELFFGAIIASTILWSLT